MYLLHDLLLLVPSRIQLFLMVVEGLSSARGESTTENTTPRSSLKYSECLLNDRRYQKVMYGEDGIGNGVACSGLLT